MVLVNRRVAYEIYPTAAQQRELWRCRKLDCDLSNATRQERIDAYRFAGKTIGFAAQCRSLTEIGADHPEYRALNAHSAQVTPRFKSYDRFSAGTGLGRNARNSIRSRLSGLDGGSS